MIKTLLVRFFLIVTTGLFSLSITVVPIASAQMSTEEIESLHYPFQSDDESGLCVPSIGSTVPIEGDNPLRAFKYLNEIQGLAAHLAAGIVGNLMKESSEKIDPKAGYPSNNYYGIAQWSKNDRWKDLVSWAQANHKDEFDFAVQLEYLWLEATDRGNIEGLRQQQDVAHAAWYWGRFYEVAIIGGSKDETPLKNVQELDDRIEFAERVFNQYGNSPTVSEDPDAPSAPGRPVVALDPGHGGAISEYTDSVTGLRDRETANSPEREDVLDVANRVKALLEPAGYTVVLLRTTTTEAVSKRERVDRAIAANASVAVSIHTTPGKINEVWPQRVGTYRQNNSDGKRVEFINKQTADLSETYAQIMAEERTKAEGHTVTTDPGQKTQEGSLNRADLPARGNITLLQLWATDIPWVYNEIEQNGPGHSITDARKQAYADGIANAIKRSDLSATPGPGGGAGICDGAVFGDLSATTLAYAWPEYHKPNYPTKKPEYNAAIEKASKEGQYVGGGKYPGVDCGGFVTRLLIDSGFEPNYNFSGKVSAGAGNVRFGQAPWVESNWQKIGSVTSTSELMPGDVAINTGKTHTFVYVGDISGFDSVVASASYSARGMGWRAPMAGRESVVDSKITWYRKR